MEQTAAEVACESALLDLHMAVAERCGQDMAEMFAKIRQTRAAHDASECGL